MEVLFSLPGQFSFALPGFQLHFYRILIIPHTADLNLTRLPWVTWVVAALSMLIFLAAEHPVVGPLQTVDI